MRGKLFILFIFLVLGWGARAESLIKLAKEEKEQIVQVEMPNGSRGSGFWINNKGYVATCWHVVKDNPLAQTLIKSTVDSYFDLKRENVIDANWVVESGKVVFEDVMNDLAVISVDPNPFERSSSFVPMVINGKKLNAHFQSATLNKNLLPAGAEVLIAGYPLGSPYAVVQSGTVASTANNLPDWGPTIKILISAVANHGNSGGPVFDDQGQVIGLLEGEFRSNNQERTGLEIVVPVQRLTLLLDINKVPYTAPDP